MKWVDGRHGKPWPARMEGEKNRAWGAVALLRQKAAAPGAVLGL